MTQTDSIVPQNLPPVTVRPLWKRVLSYIYHRYLIEAMGSMINGLFASLLIGMILKQIFNLLPQTAGLQAFATLIDSQSAAASPVVGAAIGVAVALGMKARPLVAASACVVGAIGYSVSSGGVSAGPVGAILAVIAAAEIGRLVAGKTPVDIILVPAVCVLSGTLTAILVGPAVAGVMSGLGSFINRMTELRPLAMGIAVSLVMSLVILSPLSSAALAIMLNLSGLAAGAATVGCACSMIGFAVASYQDNKVGGLIAQGIATSKIQLPNALQYPQIVIPPSIAAIVCGPLSTLAFGLSNNAYGAGMGTSGLVGQLTTWAVMQGTRSGPLLFVQILFLHVLLPALIAWLVSVFMRKKGWIKPGQMKLELRA